VSVTYMTDNPVPERLLLTVCGSRWGNPHMKYFWFGAFLVFLVLLGVYSWYAIAPVDLLTRIEHYILAPLLIVFALVILLLLFALHDR